MCRSKEKQILSAILLAMGTLHSPRNRQKPAITSFLRHSNSNIQEKVTRAEVKIAVLMAENNIPLAFSNHLSQILPKLFPDSKIVQKYSAAATKTTCMINGAITPHFLRETVNIMKCSSNDTSLEKMNPLTVKMITLTACRANVITC